MRTVAILIFSLFITLNANSALALTCKSGTADCTQSSNTASDCTALGYTNANTANCKHYLYCPFNTAYKACVAFDDSNTGCESKGYSTNKPTATGYLCKDVTVSLNGVNSTCYDCVTCKDEDLITSNTCQQICQNYGIDAQSRSYYKINTITSLNNRTGGPCYNGTYSIHKSDCCCEGTSSVALANCEEPVEPADCSDYPLTNCPEHGICDKCPDDETYKKLTGCESGYTLNASGTGCILSTCPTGYAKTADDCYNKGSAGWSLDLTDKYDSTDCYKCTAKSCEVGYSTDITSIADCGTTGSAGYTFTKSESGYSGDDACGKCECTDPCKDTYTGEIPENAHAVTEACKACDEEKDIVTDWACDDGYIINSAKTGCIPATCPTGYAKNASECSASGSGAWHLDMNNRYDSTDCYKCEPDACKGESSTTITINQCGSADIGSAGWSLGETGYSGEDKCYTCKKLACKPGYSTETTTCEAGYELVTKGYSGDDECGKCVEKDCSTGYSKSITSEANCSAGYSFKQDPDNPLCGMCEEKSCPDGSSKDIKSVADCGNGSVGAAGWIFSSSNGCGKCTERPCSGNANHTSIDKCGIGGAEGWNFSACYYGDHILGTCTAKTCKDHHMQDVRTDIGLLCKAKQVYLGNTKTDCYDCVACEDAGLSGAIFTRINDCSAICPLTGYSSTTMIYNSTRTAILHDAEGRYGVCYAWNAVSCSSSHFGDCYCKYGTSVTSCN